MSLFLIFLSLFISFFFPTFSHLHIPTPSYAYHFHSPLYWPLIALPLYSPRYLPSCFSLYLPPYMPPLLRIPFPSNFFSLRLSPTLFPYSPNCLSLLYNCMTSPFLIVVPEAVYFREWRLDKCFVAGNLRK